MIVPPSGIRVCFTVLKPGSWAWKSAKCDFSEFDENISFISGWSKKLTKEHVALFQAQVRGFTTLKQTVWARFEDATIGNEYQTVQRFEQSLSRSMISQILWPKRMITIIVGNSIISWVRVHKCQEERKTSSWSSVSLWNIELHDLW